MAQRSQVREFVRAAGREWHDVIDFEPTTRGSAGDAPVAISLQHGRAGPLPIPTVSTAGRIVLLVAWAPTERRALRAPGSGGERAAVEAAAHSLSPAAAPFSEGTDATPNGGGIRRVAEEHVAEPPARTAVKARPVGNRAVGLGEPPSMHTGDHGRTSVMVMTVCGERWLAFRATSSTT